jgi:hypothetical protein
MSTVPVTPLVDRRRLRLCLVAGILCFAICVVGAFFSPVQFFRAYLAAYVLFMGLAPGCMVILMIYHLTGGAWGFLTRRILEAGMRTLPLAAVLFIPVGCGVGYLYPWARPELVAADKKLQHQHIYLNVPFFWARAVLFFAAWMAMAYLLTRWSDAEDRGTDPEAARKSRRLSGVGLVVYGISLHFASIDWIMSLQPTFHSTIFGPLVAAGQLVSAQALVVIVLAWLVWRPPLVDVVSAETLNDVGNLLLAFLVIWAYMVWFQFMLVWIANLKVDVIWYLPRGRDGWQWVAWSLFVLHFALPFVVLLFRFIKQTPRYLATVAGTVLFMQLVFDYYQVVPAFPGTTIGEHWMDFLTPIAVGGLLLANFLWELGRKPLLPGHDVSRIQAVHLRHIDEEDEALEEALSHA